MMLLNALLLILGNTVLDSILRIVRIVASIVMAICGIGFITIQVFVLPYSLRTLREMRSKDRDISWYNHTTTLYSIGFLCLGAGLLLSAIAIFIGHANIIADIIEFSLTLIGSILILFAVFFVFRSRMLTSKENKQQRRM